MNELRQLPRWEVKKEAKVWLSEVQGFLHCIVEDMHLKGMRISFNKELPAKSPLKMSFSMGDSFDMIKVEANIPWAKRENERYVYGLSFSHIADKDKEKIFQYMNTHHLDQFRNKWWA